MRRRTQAEMDELVRSAGFKKTSQEIDPWGIFTVSVARRVRTLILRAAAASVVLSLLFLVVYGGTNWLTAQRPGGRANVVFRVELLIVPYARRS